MKEDKLNIDLIFGCPEHTFTLNEDFKDWLNIKFEGTPEINFRNDNSFRVTIEGTMQDGTPKLFKEYSDTPTPEIYKLLESSTEVPQSLNVPKRIIPDNCKFSFPLRCKELKKISITLKNEIMLYKINVSIIPQ